MAAAAQTVGNVVDAVADALTPGYPWPVPEDEQNWSKLPTCASGDECGACCKACWCPCLTMKDTMEAFGFKEGHPAFGSKSKNLPLFVGLSCGCSIGFSTILSMFSAFPAFAALLAFFPPIYWVFVAIPWVFRFLFLWALMWFRKEVTKQFNIKFCNGCGGCCFDCFCPFVCHCWSMQQDAKTIEELKPKDEGIVGQAIEAVKNIAKVL